MLTDLPTELVEHIASHVLDDVLGPPEGSSHRPRYTYSLTPLRLTCRQIAEQIDRLFIKSFFHERHVSVTHDSLRQIEAVASVDRLAKAVKRVVVHCHHIRFCFFNDFIEMARRSLPDTPAEAIHRSLFSRLLQEQELKGSFGPRMLLIMQSFFRCSQMCIAGRNDDILPVEWHSNAKYLDAFQPDLWKMALEVMLKTGRKWTEFSIDTRGSSMGINIATLQNAIVPTLQATIPHCFSVLTKFDIIYKFPGDMGMVLGARDSGLDLANFLNAIPSITTFRLSCAIGRWASVDFEGIEAALSSLTLPNMTSLTLGCFLPVISAVFTRFLRRHRQLKQVSLIAMATDDWPSCCRALVGMPNLVQLSVECLRKEWERNAIHPCLRDAFALWGLSYASIDDFEFIQWAWDRAARRYDWIRWNGKSLDDNIMSDVDMVDAD